MKIKAETSTKYRPEHLQTRRQGGWGKHVDSQPRSRLRHWRRQGRL